MRTGLTSDELFKVCLHLACSRICKDAVPGDDRGKIKVINDLFNSCFDQQLSSTTLEGILDDLRMRSVE